MLASKKKQMLMCNGRENYFITNDNSWSRNKIARTDGAINRELTLPNNRINITIFSLRNYSSRLTRTHVSHFCHTHKYLKKRMAAPI